MKKSLLLLTVLTLSMGSAQANFKESFVLNRILQKLDTNANGVIDLAEMQTRWDQQFAQFDGNHDKKLTFVEFKAMHQAMNGRASRFRKEAPKVSADTRFQQLDVNNDKVVTYTEYFDKKMNGFQKIDLNKDNAINLHELKTMKDRLQALR